MLIPGWWFEIPEVRSTGIEACEACLGYRNVGSAETTVLVGSMVSAFEDLNWALRLQHVVATCVVI